MPALKCNTYIAMNGVDFKLCDIGGKIITTPYMLEQQQPPIPPQQQQQAKPFSKLYLAYY